MDTRSHKMTVETDPTPCNPDICYYDNVAQYDATTDRWCGVNTSSSSINLFCQEGTGRYC